MIAVVKIVRAMKRKRLVRQGIDQKQLPWTVILPLFYKGNAIENMATVKEQGHDGNRDQGHAPGKKADGEKMPRTGKDQDAAGTRPEPVKAICLHQHAVGQTNGNKADQDRYAVF